MSARMNPNRPLNQSDLDVLDEPIGRPFGQPAGGLRPEPKALIGRIVDGIVVVTLITLSFAACAVFAGA